MLEYKYLPGCCMLVLQPAQSSGPSSPQRTAALPYIVTGMNGFAGLPNNDLRLGPAASKINRPMAPLPDTVGLAEFGSVQVEFDALSARTGNESYAKAADGIIHLLHKNYPEPGQHLFKPVTC